jgi:hypothetical protein
MKKIHTLIKSLSKTTVPSIALGVLCTLGAFVIGIRTSGDVQPFGTSEAALQASLTGEAIPGDINGNGMLDAEDAIAILEYADGLETAEPADIRRGDTDGDLQLTVRDALKVLKSASLR